MRNQKRRADIDGKDFVPLFRGDCFNSCGLKNTSVIDQKINLAKTVERILDRHCRVFRVAEVTFDCHGANTSRFNLLECLASLVRRKTEGKRNIRLSLRHGDGDDTAQTTGAAGNQYSFALQIAHQRNCKCGVVWQPAT